MERTLVATYSQGNLSVYVSRLRELNICRPLWADGYVREVMDIDVQPAIQYLRGYCEVEERRQGDVLVTLFYYRPMPMPTHVGKIPYV